MKTFTIAQPSPEKLKYKCLECNFYTNHEEIFVCQLGPIIDHFCEEASEVVYKNIKCCGCDCVSFAKTTNTYETNYSGDIPEYEREPKVTTILYPSRREKPPSVNNGFLMPKNIQTIFLMTRTFSHRREKKHYTE